MAADPKSTAVVLIEFQNDFTSDGGALHGAVQEVMDSTSMLENTKKLVDEARAAGATVIHAPIPFAEGYGEITDHPYGILAGVVDNNAFVKGTWGAAIVDDLAPQARTTSSSRASAAWTRSPARTWTSSCGARASRRSRSAGS